MLRGFEPDSEQHDSDGSIFTPRVSFRDAKCLLLRVNNGLYV